MSGNLLTGTCISYSAATPSTFDQTGYEALSWTESAEIINIGDLGGETEVVNYSLVCSGNTKKRLGARNEGQHVIEAEYNKDSAAQGILVTAETNKTIISVKIDRSTGDAKYYQGYVVSNKDLMGGASDLVKLQSTLEIEGGTVVTV